MSTCVHTNASHLNCSNTETKTTNISIISNNYNNNSNSYRNYGNQIAITSLPTLPTLPALQTLSTLNCSDIGIDVNNYGNNCLNQSIQTIRTNTIPSHMVSMPSMCSSSVPSVAPNAPKPAFIQIPFGWKRELIDGRIVYYSPTNCCLQSMEQLSGYLESDGTCKCGLECPLHLLKTFSFDVCVRSEPYDIEVAKHSNQNKLCNHKRKTIAMATYREHSLQTQQLIAQQFQQQNSHKLSHTMADSDSQSYELEYSPIIDSKLQQRHDFQSSDSVCAQQTTECLTISSAGNQNLNSSQTRLQVRNYPNDAIIDAVSVIHSNQNLTKSGQILGMTETSTNRSTPQNCSNLMPQNMNRFQPQNERQTIIGSQQQYIEQTSNCGNRCQYSVPMTAEQVPQAANSFCVYDQNGNSGVYSFSACDSTQLAVRPNDTKTSIYLTPQNTANYGQMISYESPNINLIQPSHTQAFSSETYSHAFHPSDNVCNSNITTIPSYIPIHSSPNSANSGAISFSASPLATTAITLNPTYHSHLQTSQDNSRCHSQNNISIVRQNPPMPPLSVPNVTTVTTSVTDVIPAVGVAPQMINTTNPSGAPQVLQFINSVPLTQITANTVTVLQQTAAQDVPVPATTLIIPQLMSPHEHSMVINHAMAPQTAMFPHIATAAGLTSLPNAFQNAISIANAISLPQRNCFQESTKPFTRTRKRKDYNRTNRSHPPTVASILKQAADMEKKQKEQELQEVNEKQKLQQKDKELQTISETNDTISGTHSPSEPNVYTLDSSQRESISVAVQSELTVDSEKAVISDGIDCNGSQPMESLQSDNECSDSSTGDNSLPVVHQMSVHNNENSDSSSEHSSPSSEFCNGTGSDSGVESEPIANQLCDNCEAPDAQQVVDSTRQRSLRRLKRLRKELSVYYGNDNSDDESPQSPPLPPQTRTFNTGDLVWGQMGDVRYWPGKLVGDEELVGLSIQREVGKLIVKWFGDHTLTQVEPENLKTLSEGLEEHHCARKRHRSGKRMNSFLEQAIQEAMSELDRQTDDLSSDCSTSRVLGVVTSTQTIDTID